MDPIDYTIGYANRYLSQRRQALQDEAYAELERLGRVKPGEISARGLGHNDWVDAYRHAYASARLAHDYGPTLAWAYGDLRERFGPTRNPWNEQQMDLKNNQFGRNVGVEAARQRAAGGQPDIGAMVLQALDAGTLIPADSDPRIGPPPANAGRPGVAGSASPGGSAASTGSWSQYAPSASAGAPRPFWLPDPEVDPTTGEPLKPIEWWQRRPPELTPEMRRLYGL
jgi:hypothetical protein